MRKFLKAVGVIVLVLVVAFGYLGFRVYKEESERTQSARNAQQAEDALQALAAATSAIPSKTPTAKASTAPSEAPTATDAEPETAPATGIRPEFQEAMDSYEAFFDEYFAFMKSYQESANPASLMTDYLEYIAQYTETMEKLSQLGEEDLSEEEALYYAEVSLRINQKLLEVAG